MAYNKQKLLRFKETIFKSVEFEIMKIKEKIERHEKTELENLKNQKLNEVFVSMQTEIKNIKLKFDQKISKKILEAKNEILTFRNKLIEKFKESCEKELLNFVQTPDYEHYLIESVKNSCKNLNLGEKATLKLKRTDLKFKNKILTIANFSSTEADDSIKIGGFKIILEKQKILIDKTLVNMLKNELKQFNKNCELALNFSDNISKEG